MLDSEYLMARNLTILVSDMTRSGVFSLPPCSGEVKLQHLIYLKLNGKFIFANKISTGEINLDENNRPFNPGIRSAVKTG